MTFGFGNQHSIQLSYGRVGDEVYRLLPCPCVQQRFQGQCVSDYNARVCNDLGPIAIRVLQQADTGEHARTAPHRGPGPSAEGSQ